MNLTLGDAQILLDDLGDVVNRDVGIALVRGVRPNAGKGSFLALSQRWRFDGLQVIVFSLALRFLGVSST